MSIKKAFDHAFVTLCKAMGINPDTSPAMYEALAQAIEAYETAKETHQPDEKPVYVGRDHALYLTPKAKKFLAAIESDDSPRALRTEFQQQLYEEDSPQLTKEEKLAIDCFIDFLNERKTELEVEQPDGLITDAIVSVAGAMLAIGKPDMKDAIACCEKALDALNAMPKRESISVTKEDVARVARAIGLTFVPDGIYNIIEEFKTIEAAKAAIAALGGCPSSVSDKAACLSETGENDKQCEIPVISELLCLTDTSRPTTFTAQSTTIHTQAFLDELQKD